MPPVLLAAHTRSQDLASGTTAECTGLVLHNGPFARVQLYTSLWEFMWPINDEAGSSSEAGDYLVDLVDRRPSYLRVTPTSFRRIRRKLQESRARQCGQLAVRQAAAMRQVTAGSPPSRPRLRLDGS